MTGEPAQINCGFIREIESVLDAVVASAGALVAAESNGAHHRGFLESYQ